MMPLGATAMPSTRSMSAQWATGAPVDPRSGLADSSHGFALLGRCAVLVDLLSAEEECWLTKAAGIGASFDDTGVADGMVSRPDILSRLDRHDEASEPDVELARARF